MATLSNQSGLSHRAIKSHDIHKYMTTFCMIHILNEPDESNYCTRMQVLGWYLKEGNRFEYNADSKNHFLTI